MSEFPNYIKPVPEDPGNLVERLNATGVPINRGIAMLINAPALVEGYSCANCGHRGEFVAPERFTRDEVKAFKCQKCRSERVSLNCRAS